MKVLVYDTHKFEKLNLDRCFINKKINATFLDVKLNVTTAQLAKGFDAVCIFVNDICNDEVIQILSRLGVKLISLRCAGYNNVDLLSAQNNRIFVSHVPEYSPYSVAEHAVALLMSLNRKIHKSYMRTRENNFSLDGLVGFDLKNKTIGIIGFGRIGQVMAKIMHGFGCRILIHDKNELHLKNNFKTKEIDDCEWVEFDSLMRRSDIISLHVPLNQETRFMINENSLSLTKKGVFIINTSRGALIQTKSLIDAIKKGQVGAAGLDVYEEEGPLFFTDHSEEVLSDDIIARLMTFPNVLITSHQGFLTQEALENISETTALNISQVLSNETCYHLLKV